MKNYPDGESGTYSMNWLSIHLETRGLMGWIHTNSEVYDPWTLSALSVLVQVKKGELLGIIIMQCNVLEKRRRSKISFWFGLIIFQVSNKGRGICGTEKRP